MQPWKKKAHARRYDPLVSVLRVALVLILNVGQIEVFDERKKASEFQRDCVLVCFLMIVSGGGGNN